MNKMKLYSIFIVICLLASSFLLLLSKSLKNNSLAWKGPNLSGVSILYGWIAPRDRDQRQVQITNTLKQPVKRGLSG